MSTQQDAILERIGHTLVDVYEDVTIEALPEPMVMLLDLSALHQSVETNILCTLIGALAHPEQYRFFEKDGELFFQPIERD